MYYSPPLLRGAHTEQFNDTATPNGQQFNDAASSTKHLNSCSATWEHLRKNCIERNAVHPRPIQHRHAPCVATRRHASASPKNPGSLSLSLSFSWKNGGPKQRRALSARRSAPKAKSPPQDIGPQTPRVPESRSAADTRPHSRRAPRLLFCESQLVRGGARGGP